MPRFKSKDLFPKELPGGLLLFGRMANAYYRVGSIVAIRRSRLHKKLPSRQRQFRLSDGRYAIVLP